MKYRAGIVVGDRLRGRNSRPQARRRWEKCFATAAAAWIIAWIALVAPFAARADETAVGGSEPSAETPASQPETAEKIAEKQRQVAERIAETEAALQRLAAQGPSQAGHLSTRLDMLKYLAAILAERRAFADQADQQALHAEAVEELELHRTAGMAVPPPYSVLLLEELRDQAAAEAGRTESIQAEIEATRQLLTMMRQTHATREKQRRAAREAAQRNRDPSAAAALGAALELAELTSEVARETVRLYADQLAAKEQELATNTLRRQLVDEQVRTVAAQVVFSEDDLKKIHAELGDMEQQLLREIEQKQAALRQAQQVWLEAKSRFEKDPDNLDAQAALAARETARECLQKEALLLQQRVGQIGLLHYCWDARYEILNGQATRGQLERWRDEAERFTERLRRTEQLAELDFDRCRRELAAAEENLGRARRENQPEAPWIQLEVDSLHRLAAAQSNALVSIDDFAVLVQRLDEHLNETLGGPDAKPMLAAASSLLTTIWNYEITAVDDQPITVRKLAGTLLFLLAGFFISRHGSRMIGRRVLPRFGLDGGNAAALQTIAFYFLFLGFAYFSLEVAGVPVTVFAFLGGAIAIGVGFGSQNILNNFISGLILLFERPIRVGDLVNIDGLHGTIDHVGARSTRIRTGSNLEIIVPNSRFLENNVTNLTLSDERIRACISVGVAYGSPARRVADLLRQAVLDHEKVLRQPEPIILFKDFGDNSLLFEAHFWIRMRTMMQGESIESEIRFAVDELFAAEDITISFPQRDVHLDTTSPIEIRLRNDEEQGVLSMASGERAA